MNNSRWDGLSLVCIEYPAGDRFGHILAFTSLAPLVLIVSFVTIVVHNRELPTIVFFAGQLISEWINLRLKRLIQQGRPDNLHNFSLSPENFGMPSGHSQSMAFFTTFACLYFIFKAPRKNATMSCVLMVSLILFTLCVTISRVYLLYHFWSQCFFGTCIGCVLGFTWFRVAYGFIEPNCEKILQMPLIRWFDLKPYSKNLKKKS